MSGLVSAMMSADAAARRQRIQAIHDGLRVRGATTPDRACTLAEVGLTESQEIREMVDTGVLVVDRRTGRWYLDEAAFISQRDVRTPLRGRRLVVTLLVAILALMPWLLIKLHFRQPSSAAAVGAPAASSR